MIKGSVEIGFNSEADAKKALSALKAELGEHERSKASMELKGKALLVTVEASDVVALRASMNTYLRLLSVVTAGLREGI